MIGIASFTRCIPARILAPFGDMWQRVLYRRYVTVRGQYPDTNLYTCC